MGWGYGAVRAQGWGSLWCLWGRQLCEPEHVAVVAECVQPCPGGTASVQPPCGVWCGTHLSELRPPVFSCFFFSLLCRESWSLTSQKPWFLLRNQKWGSSCSSVCWLLSEAQLLWEVTLRCRPGCWDHTLGAPGHRPGATRWLSAWGRVGVGPPHQLPSWGPLAALKDLTSTTAGELRLEPRGRRPGGAFPAPAPGILGAGGRGSPGPGPLWGRDELTPPPGAAGPSVCGQHSPPPPLEGP